MTTPLRFIILFMLCSMLISCDPEEEVNPDLLGFWVTEKISFNGIDGNEIMPGINSGFHLNLTDSSTYFRNYSMGMWTLNNDQLKLIPTVTSGERQFTYTIKSHSKELLILEIVLKESEYCCDFPAFEADEPLSIVEVYKRPKN